MTDTSTAAKTNPGVLTNRKTTIGVFLLFLCFSVLSWRYVVTQKPATHHHFYFFGRHLSYDPITIFGLGFSIFVVLSIAFRSPLRVDRFIFGAAAIPFAMAIVREFAFFTGAPLLAFRLAVALVWTTVAAMCAAHLAELNRGSV